MLRGRALGEADRILTLLTTERGKLDVVAKGVRRAKSHLAGRLEFGNECELQMHRGRSLDVVVHADIIYAPWEKLVVPERFASAQLVAELIDAFCEPDLAVSDVYALVRGALGAIADNAQPESVVPRFEMRLLAALGIEPPLDACIVCAQALEDRAWLDGQSGGLACTRCHERWRDSVELDSEDLENMRAIAAPREGGRARFYARPRVADAISDLIAHHLGRRPKATTA